jgi:hypothetical protein
VVKHTIDKVKPAWVEKDGRKMFEVAYTREFGTRWTMLIYARDELEAYLEVTKKLGAS